jgi:hypothetical protein
MTQELYNRGSYSNVEKKAILIGDNEMKLSNIADGKSITVYSSEEN